MSSDCQKNDGSDSIQTEKVYEFRTMLENKMRSTGMKGVDVVWQDERLTTVMAEKVLIEAMSAAKKRKEVIDKTGGGFNHAGLFGHVIHEKKINDEQLYPYT